MPSYPRLAAASILVLSVIAPAAAQEPRVHASVRGGATSVLVRPGVGIGFAF